MYSNKEYLHLKKLIHILTVWKAVSLECTASNLLAGVTTNTWDSKQQLILTLFSANDWTKITGVPGKLPI